jgi:hypothetical protein
MYPGSYYKGDDSTDNGIESGFQECSESLMNISKTVSIPNGTILE